MDFDEIKIRLQKIEDSLNKIAVALKYEEKVKEANEIDKKSFDADFYSDMDMASKLLQKKKSYLKCINKVDELEKMITDAREYIQLAEEMNDKESFNEASNLTVKLEERISLLEVDTLLGSPYDLNNAIITIHPGAGGIESQDWALMLYRMYSKWALKNEFEIEELDFQDGEEAGIKSASILVKGENAYGYLKSENGVHRLVRISPFDASSRRHTSFASVEVLPELDDSINIEIRDEDVEMDTFRASGAGGQHVNKTSSAVRLRHIPTGIVVSCQTERSQFQNRDYAMKMLKAKLYKLEQEKNMKKINDIKGNVSDNAFGSQIRSYVFCPYTMVKDHRTGYEVGNVSAVMDGKIDDFIYEYLKYVKNSGII